MSTPSMPVSGTPPDGAVAYKDDKFPPWSTRDGEIALALNAFGSAIEGRSAVYVSTPITTGHRFAEWRRGPHALEPGHPNYVHAHGKHVIEPNRSAVRPLISALRNESHRIVIDPTAFVDVPGWTQDDYRVF